MKIKAKQHLVKHCCISLPTGLDKIEYLQMHSSDRIYKLAGRIIEKYFSEDDNFTELDSDKT